MYVAIIVTGISKKSANDPLTHCSQVFREWEDAVIFIREESVTGKGVIQELEYLDGRYDFLTMYKIDQTNIWVKIAR